MFLWKNKLLAILITSAFALNSYADVNVTEDQTISSGSSAIIFKAPDTTLTITGHFCVDFDMGNGLRLASYCQQDPRSSREIGERIVGTKGILYTHVSYGACKITDHKGKVLYAPNDRYCNELIEEHKFFLSNLRAGKQVNTLKQLVNSTLLAIAGRMSAYSGKKFKFEWMMRKSQESLVPEKMGFYKNPVAGVPVPGKYRLY